MVHDLHTALRFLADLADNNTRPWFEANRGRYEEAMGQFESLVAALLTGVGKWEDLEGLTPKDCIMRIYRDVRFSRDKRPYKTGFGAGIAPGGRKSGRMGYHLHLGPGGATMVAGGLWDPTPLQLAGFRNAIVKDAAPFTKILAAASFRKHFGTLTGDSLKTAPRGYPADHPHVDLLRRTQVCVSETFADSQVTSPEFPRLALQSMKAMKPFLDYLTEVAARG